MIFHVVVSVYQLVKIWNSPQFLAHFRNALSVYQARTLKKLEKKLCEQVLYFGMDLLMLLLLPLSLPVPLLDRIPIQYL